MNANDGAAAMLRDVADLVSGPRKDTHGDALRQFRCHGELLQVAMRYGQSYEPEELAGIAMLTAKLARFIAGDRTEVDHLRDLAGYAALLAALIGEGGGWLRKQDGSGAVDNA